MSSNATEELFDSLMKQIGCSEYSENNESSDDGSQSKFVYSPVEIELNQSSPESIAITNDLKETCDATTVEVSENCPTLTSLCNKELHENSISPENSTTSTDTIVPEKKDKNLPENSLTFECKGCKSKFYLLRFYYQHMQRKTTEVIYDCDECDDQMTFPNTCMLKLHLKEHEKKAETLTPSKLKAKIPQIEEFKKNYLLEFREEAMEKYGVTEEDIENNNRPKECPECLCNVSCLRTHLMQRSLSRAAYVNCKDCGFMLPSECSLRIHKRIHSKSKPYSCPECGLTFITWVGLEKHLLNVCYHYYRSVRSKCLICGVILPGDTSVLRLHLMTNHNQLTYKCCFCHKFFSQFKEINLHLSTEHDVKHVNNAPRDCLFHKCQLCPGSLIPRKQYARHISNHVNDSQCLIFGYKCQKCDFVTMNKSQFTNHLEKCDEDDATSNKPKRAVKRVSSNEESQLESPITKKISLDYPPKEVDDKKQSSNSLSPGNGSKEVKSIDCCVCNKSSEENQKSQSVCPLHDCSPSYRCLLCGSLLKRGSVSFHFSDYHKIQCSDYSKYLRPGKERKLKVLTNKPPLQLMKVKPPLQIDQVKDKNPLQCPTCDYIAPSKDSFRSHVVVHRSGGSFQCLECGECFVARSSLEIHLISVHGFNNPDEYIASNNVHHAASVAEENSRQLKENQCSVCLEEFPDSKSLHLHFRSHGMAFLKQNLSKKVS